MGGSLPGRPGATAVRRRAGPPSTRGTSRRERSSASRSASAVPGPVSGGPCPTSSASGSRPPSDPRGGSIRSQGWTPTGPGPTAKGRAVPTASATTSAFRSGHHSAPPASRGTCTTSRTSNGEPGSADGRRRCGTPSRSATAAQSRGWRSSNWTTAAGDAQVSDLRHRRGVVDDVHEPHAPAVVGDGLRGALHRLVDHPGQAQRVLVKRRRRRHGRHGTRRAPWPFVRLLSVQPRCYRGRWTMTDRPTPVLSADPPRRARAARLARLLEAHAVLYGALDSQLQAEHGLPLSQYEVLKVVRDAPGEQMRMADVADRVLLSRSGLTRLVDRLACSGLLERRACPSDARGALAHLTPLGRERLDAARRTHLEACRRLFPLPARARGAGAPGRPVGAGRRGAAAGLDAPRPRSDRHEPPHEPHAPRPSWVPQDLYPFASRFADVEGARRALRRRGRRFAAAPAARQTRRGRSCTARSSRAPRPLPLHRRRLPGLRPLAGAARLRLHPGRARPRGRRVW
jgi:DNA-binding MarR family transcriptional regulator